MDKEMDKELEYEKKHLIELKKYINDTLKNQEDELIEQEKRVDILFKSTGGTFSQDYELAYNRLNFLKDKDNNLKESSDKPYFGRIDFKERLRLNKESFYIGKHAIRDPKTQDDYVIDWRAPIADLYYSKTLGKTEYKAPVGFIDGDFSLKRRFTYTKGLNKEIDKYFDDGDQIIIAQTDSDGDGKALSDEFLRINLEESSTEKLKEIVATIAKEQNEIIRGEKNIPIIVQGSAGAGKTTVALHRLSYLLYKHKDALKDMDVCIIAPNSLFLDYIRDVLPDLGSKDVVQTTLENMILKELKLKKFKLDKDEILKSILESGRLGEINKEVSRLKGSEEFLELLIEIKKRYEEELSNRDGILVYNEELFTKDEIERLFKEDLKHLSMNDRIINIESYVNKNIKLRVEEVSKKIESKYDRKVKVIKNLYSGDEKSLRAKIIEIYDERDSRLKNILKESKAQIKEYFKAFKIEKIEDIYSRYINDEDFVKGILEENSYYIEEDILENIVNFNKKEVTSDDLAPLMYLKVLIMGTEHEFSHMVVDEAQDYSYLQIQVLKMMVKNNSMTLVGDLAQGIYSYRAIKSWDVAKEIYSEGSNYYKLVQSYRSTIEIINEANKTLRKMNLNIDEAIPVLRHGRQVEKVSVTDGTFNEEVKKVIEIMEKDGRNTLAIVTKTFKEAKELHKKLIKDFPEFILIDGDKKKSSLKKVVIPSYMTKGLEFDCVIMEDEGAYGDNDLDLRLKYVVLTRALHLEYIFHK